ncbi:MAG: serine/threonine protein kinase [Deltaproteobacteria bacterium]|nr:serine/threonine protein kinase [Deltaproteobacteria bacterium]
MSAPVREGDILAGKYRVERVLAQGGMGVVVAAIHQQLEQRVALKFLLPDEMKNESVVGRFLREARAAVRLRSEHVARVLDVGTAETGSPYIVMEYLEGRDLSAVLAEGQPISVRSAVSYVLQASEAVAEAHALGIVHRDLKPANLFLTHRADGTACVKVLDFGVSKMVGRELGMTKTNAVLGTPFYMAPEQLRSSRDADVRSDVWALGMVLYELLTGTVAFERETLPALCMAIMNDPVPSPRAVRPDVPAELEDIIYRALAKEPSHRYASLAELAQALAPFSPLGAASERRISRVLGEKRPETSDPPSPFPNIVAAPVEIASAEGRTRATVPGTAASPLKLTANDVPPLGVTNRIVVDAASANDDLVDPPSTTRGRPLWFTATLGVLLLAGAIGIVLTLASRGGAKPSVTAAASSIDGEPSRAASSASPAVGASSATATPSATATTTTTTASPASPLESGAGTASTAIATAPEIASGSLAMKTPPGARNPKPQGAATAPLRAAPAATTNTPAPTPAPAAAAPRAGASDDGLDALGPRK